MKPLVSVILPVFNEKKEYLTLAIKSILNQSFNSFELLIIDDSTNLQCFELAKFFKSKDNRIVYLRNPNRINLASALHFGIMNSRGIYISRMDSDDISLENRLQIQFNYLEQNPEIFAVGSSIILIDENNDEIGIRHFASSYEEIKKKAYVRNPIAHPSVMFRKNIYDHLGGYNVSFNKAEDYELWLRALKLGYKIANLNKPLLKYRISLSNPIRNRTHENWIYNLKAKIANFSLSNPITYIFGLMIPLTALITPKTIMNKIYKKSLLEKNKRGNII